VRTSPRILSTTSTELAAGDVHLDRLMVVDLAKAIVGHTTEQTARLWFQLHPGALPGRDYVCEIDEVTASGDALQVLPVAFDGSDANTFVVDVDGLAPGHIYSYRLLLRPEGSQEPRTGRQLTVGAFRTAAGSAPDMTMYFGSCHKPVDTDAYDPSRDMRLWRRLARRDDADLLLLLGDQIYGDSIPKPDDGGRWFDSYVRRYNAFWTFQPVRDVIGSTPTYMIPDDHEVTDSWGLDDEIDATRIRDGVEAFRVFQLAHGPTGREGSIHYSLRRGPVAAFMTDGRTARRKDSDAPILGRDQWAAMERWAASREVADADVVVIGCAVPPALLPVEQLEDVAEGGVTTFGAIAGAFAGFVLAGPPGAGIGALIGGVGANIIYEAVDEDIGTKFNATDTWTWQSNQPDLKRLLDLAFDLANDTVGGRNGEHPRLVVLLGGDAHIGAIHRITSDHTGGAADHSRNPQVLQLTSSAIGRNPLDHQEMITLLEHVGGEFTADSEQGDHYRAKQLGLLLHERTLGRLHVDRVGPGRTYRLHATVEGEATSLNHLVEVDLDADEVGWNDLIGQVVATRGVPTLLRVHEIGDAIGGAANRLEDVEAVFQLDGQSGRWFGFPLRRGADEPMARGMLDVLRTALNTGTPVRVAYRRTGPTNGEAIRVTAQP
ncbi:alkaline phosphatase D family protein, partial [Georgenia sp. 10Sc9-8]|nr:alkaline phosphatase D family protein [Georgenia halotolerans]